MQFVTEMAKTSDIVFKISGSALSFLYYECDKSRMDQVGFLIGEKHSYMKKTISDSDLNGVRNETFVYINACLAVGTPLLFCNNVGRVDKVRLKEVLGPLEEDVLGWFIFRRNSGLSPLLRGTMLHRELLNALPHVNPESFVLCCIGSDSDLSRSTHRYRHVFLLYENMSFQPISVPVTNLGQPQDNSYRTLSITNSSSLSINEIISSLKFGKNAGGLSIMKALQRPLQDRIMQIAAQVQQFDRMTQTLENEIQEIISKKYERITVEQLNHASTNVKSPSEVGDSSSTQGSQCLIEENVKEETQSTIEDVKEEPDEEESEEVIYSSQSKNDEFSEPRVQNKPVSKEIKMNSNSPSLLDYEQSPEY